jgi:methionyl-tRNA synthetase
MRINTYDEKILHDAFGIEMGAMELPGSTRLGVSWGRVRPGVRSTPDRHDETELFVIVRGIGDIVVDAAPHQVGPGTVVMFDPFETHTLENTGETDIVFASIVWREEQRAARAATETGRRRFGERPLFVFSTPPTPNGDLHLGHLSGPYLGADAFVRFQRMNGARAWHLTGSDDYQSYVLARAATEHTTPDRVAAHWGEEIAATLALMDIHPDQYTVTSADPGYAEGLRGFFDALLASGAVTRRSLPSLADAETARYLYEVDVTGTCPGCGAGTSGNICEECGEPNVVVDLVEPRSKISGSVRATRTNQFALPLHEFRDAVEAHHRVGRVPARLRELAGRIFDRPALDLPVSHPAPWGVNPQGVDDQVIWVWPEMSYGFLHGIAALGARLGETWRADKPEPDWKIVHFFGYDNSFYHAVLYPVLYRLAFPGWEPDIDYHVNEFYLLEGEKFSTSRRHAVWGKDILSPETADAVRYYLARTRPEGRRTNFDPDDYAATVQHTLIEGWQAWLNDLGDRLNARFEGVVPDAGNWAPQHTAFLARLGTRLAAITTSLGQDGFSLRAAVAELDGIVADARDLAAREGVLADDPRWHAEARTTIALELAAARLLARVATPVIPRFAGRLAALLGDPDPIWPSLIDLVPPGTRVDLSGQVYFAAHPAHPARDPAGKAEAAELAWLADVVRTTLDLPGSAEIADRTLLELGASSLQAVAIQYQILQRWDVDLATAELLSESNVAAIARQLTAGVNS